MDYRSVAGEVVLKALRATVYDPREVDGPAWQDSPLRALLPGAELVAAFVLHLRTEIRRFVESAPLPMDAEFWSGKTGREVVDLIEALLKDALLQPWSQAPPALAEPPPSPSVAAYAPSAAAENASLVRIFYATDRMRLPSWKGVLAYGSLRSLLGSLNYGVCAISIPKIHKVGKLESPSILKLEFRPDPEKHIVLAEIESLEEQVFLERVAAAVAKSSAKDAFVFVHGYNVPFEDAARRTGQIAFDLQFGGAPIFYSWPSNGKLAEYLKDETNAAWSAPHFQRFLNLLAAHSGAARIHVIAHSMGNRIVCEALKSLSYDPANQLKINHLVLAAPDMDADTFRELASILRKLSGSITLYESANDKALLASKKIHGYARAGEPLLVIPGIDVIDATAVDTDFLGHSYFSDNWPLLSDMYSMLVDDKPAAGRFGLEARASAEGTYYAFRG